MLVVKKNRKELSNWCFEVLEHTPIVFSQNIYSKINQSSINTSRKVLKYLKVHGAEKKAVNKNLIPYEFERSRILHF